MRNFIIQTLFNTGIFFIYQSVFYKFLPLLVVRSFWSWQCLLLLIVITIVDVIFGFLKLSTNN